VKSAAIDTKGQSVAGELETQRGAVGIRKTNRRLKGHQGVTGVEFRATSSGSVGNFRGLLLGARSDRTRFAAEEAQDEMENCPRTVPISEEYGKEQDATEEGRRRVETTVQDSERFKDTRGISRDSSHSRSSGA